MTIRRILVMHSIEDDLSRHRMDALSQLTQYEAFHFFIQEESGNDVRKLATVLESKIETFNPDLVWVHLSLSADVMGEPFLQLIDKLQKKFSTVLFVTDRDLRLEYKDKYAIRSIWDDPYGELYHIILAVAFHVTVDDEDPSVTFGFITDDGDSE